jgi:aldose 1-epimerase
VHSPSGEQLEIAFADQRAVITEVGGGLRSYSADGRQLLDGYSDREMAPSGRGQVLVPWPNRIAEGRYEFGGEQRELPINEPETGSAIHGLVRWVAWTVSDREAHRVVVEHRLHPQPGYPFAVALSIEYALSEDGLRVSTTATNVGVDPCPYGAGAHPYLNPGTPTVDTAILKVPARTVLDVGPVDGTEFDFSNGRPVGGTKLDHCFTDLERDDDGLARVALRSPEGDAGLTLWADEAYGYLMLYTGDGRPDVSRRSLAVEPMTCPPHAFRTGESVIVIPPGDSVESTWGLAPYGNQRTDRR